MKNVIDLSHLSSKKRINLIVAVVLFGISVSIVACSEQFVETESQAVEDPRSNAVQDADTYVVVEEMPEIVGGLRSIQENLVYPEFAMEAGIEGRVIIQFVVDEEGEVQNPVVVRGIGSGLDAAALKAVESATFVPGKQRGVPVKVKMSLPITFKLSRNADGTLNEQAEKRVDGHVDGDVTMPELIGGLASIQQVMRYPEAAREDGIEGRVIIQFTVDKEGQVRDAHVVKGVGIDLDNEALRVVETARFKPGMLDGEPTEVKLSLPITFKLPNATETTEERRINDRNTDDALVLGIDQDGRLSLAGAPVEGHNLVKELRRAFDNADERVLSVRVSESAPPEIVQAAMDRTREAGSMSTSFQSIRQ